MKRKLTSAKEMVNARTSAAGPTTFKVPSNMQLFKFDRSVIKIDILPYVTKTNPYVDADCLHYERTFYQHTQIGAERRNYVCPNRTIGERCPICDYVRTLPDDTEEEKKLIRNLLPKQRQLFIIVDREETDTGPQLWEYSYHNFGKILKTIIDADEDENHIHFHSPDEGHSMRVLFEQDKVGEKGRPFWKAITIEFKKRKEPYSDELIDSLPCLDELLTVHSYDELQAIFQHEEHDSVDGPANISGKTEVDADAPWVKGNDDGGFGEKQQQPAKAVAGIPCPGTADAAAEKEFKDKDDDDWD